MNEVPHYCDILELLICCHSLTWCCNCGCSWNIIYLPWNQSVHFPLMILYNIMFRLFFSGQVHITKHRPCNIFLEYFNSDTPYEIVMSNLWSNPRPHPAKHETWKQIAKNVSFLKGEWGKEREHYSYRTTRQLNPQVAKYDNILYFLFRRLHWNLSKVIHSKRSGLVWLVVNKQTREICKYTCTY